MNKRRRNPFGSAYQSWLEAPFQEAEAEREAYDHHVEQILSEIEGTIIGRERGIEIMSEHENLVEKEVEWILRFLKDGEPPNYESAARDLIENIHHKYLEGMDYE